MADLPRWTPKASCDLSGWQQVSCHQAEVIRRAAANLSVASSRTDVSTPDTFTEWWWTGDQVRFEVPVLREYLDREGCRHYLAESPETAAECDTDKESAHG